MTETLEVEKRIFEYNGNRFVYANGGWNKVVSCPNCEHEIVVPIVGAHKLNKVDKPKKKRKRYYYDPDAKKGNPYSGYVYLMRSENGFHKIGIAKNVESRRTALSRQFPIKISVVHFIASNNYRIVERKLHDKFVSKRIEYEWFKLEQKDIQWFSALKDYELD